MADETLTLERILKANPPRAADVTHGVVDIDFDRDADMLYVAFGGGPVPAISVSMDVPDQDVYLRVEPETLRIVGLDILSFRRRFLAINEDAQRVFGPLCDVTAGMDWRLQVHPACGDGSNEETSPATGSALVACLSALLSSFAAQATAA